MVPLLTSIGFIIAGVWSLVLIKKEFGIGFVWQSKKTIIYHLKDGWHVFQQQFYVSMYSQINIIFLGIFTNDTTVGYYSIAEKILAVPLSLFGVGVQAYYPYAVNVFKKNINDYFIQIQKISISLVVISGLISIGIILFNNEIVKIITGTTDKKTIIEILNILVLGIIFSSFGHFYTQIFITLGKSKILNKVSFRVMVMNLIFSPLVIYIYGAIGLACFVLFRQSLVIGISYRYIHKFKKEFLKG